MGCGRAVVQSFCRLEYLRILCNHENYLALNLPLSSKRVIAAIQPLTPQFKRRHFLAWTLLSEVQRVLGKDMAK